VFEGRYLVSNYNLNIKISKPPMWW
jgi:hypothetical protein